MTTLKQKYQPVLALVNEFAMQKARVWEEAGKLHIQAVVEKPEERDAIAGKIAELAGDMPADLVARIVADFEGDMESI